MPKKGWHLDWSTTTCAFLLVGFVAIITIAGLKFGESKDRFFLPIPFLVPGLAAVFLQKVFIENIRDVRLAHRILSILATLSLVYVGVYFVLMYGFALAAVVVGVLVRHPWLIFASPAGLYALAVLVAAAFAGMMVALLKSRERALATKLVGCLLCYGVIFGLTYFGVSSLELRESASPPPIATAPK